jgi:DNA-binding transcriptional regulator YiaG
MTETEEADSGRELVASMQEAATIVRGEKDAARVHLPPGGTDVRALWERLGLTRPAFAHLYRLEVAAVCDWEQGCAGPTRQRALLMVIARNSETVAQAVAEVQAA